MGTSYADLVSLDPTILFTCRSECAKAGAHTQTIAGISPHKQFGAFSIVLAAGYEDDIDEGEAL